MTRLNTTEHDFNMSWDEYVIAVEDSYGSLSRTLISSSKLIASGVR